MKILFVADLFPNPNSGASGTEFQTIKALRQLGHEVDEIWADAIPRWISHPNLHYLLELPRGFAKAIARACENKDYDVIHCNQPHAFLAAREHCKAGRPGVFVNRSHGFEAHAAEVLGRWRQRWGEQERRFPRNLAGILIDAEMRRHCRLVARHVDGMIVSSSGDRDFILDHYGILADRLVCIPQAPPEAFVQTALLPMTPARREKMLFIGPPQFWKGPDVLAPAVESLMERYPGLCLTWVCSSEEQKVAGAFFSARIRARILFQNPLPQEDLLELYDRHGIFLFPSLFEGFGKVFLEAMARGLCVVASKTGGMVDVITSGKDGLLVPVGDYARLAKGVEQLLTSPEMAVEVAAAARKTAAAYSWERVGRETAEFYQSLLRLKG